MKETTAMSEGAVSKCVSPNKRILMDKQTGEIIWADHITKVCKPGRIWNCFIADQLTALGIRGEKPLIVLTYIVEHIGSANNTYFGSYGKLATALGMSKPTLANTMRILQKNNIIKRLQNGIWLVNPSVLVDAGKKYRQLLVTYKEAEQKE